PELVLLDASDVHAGDGVGGVHERAASAGDDVLDRPVAHPDRIALVVVHVAADRRHIAVGRIAYAVVDGPAAPAGAGVMGVVDVDRLAGDQDFRQRPGRDPSQPLTLVAVEPAVDPGVDADDHQPTRVQQPVGSGLDGPPPVPSALLGAAAHLAGPG